MQLRFEPIRKEPDMKKRLARRGSHFWKIFALTLTGIISFVLVTGCSSSTGSTENPNADATQKEAGVVEGKTQGESAAVLPGEARIGIAYPEGDDEFTNLFITKTISYLVSAGIPEENITRMSGAEEELAENVKKLVDDKCSVLMVGGADENTAPGITDAAVKAKIPVVFFGTSPGEAEIARWEKKEIRASYVGGTYEQAAQKRADLIDSTGFEKLDQGKDDNIGLVVLYTGEDEPGDKVNRDTLGIIGELDLPIYVLTDDEEEADPEEDQEAVESEGQEEAQEAQEAAEELTADEVRESAKEQVIEWMKEYGKSLDVILCADDMQALGAWDAVSEEKKRVGHDVVIMGFDSNMDSITEVAAGNIRSTFFNDFMEQSGNASNAVLSYLKGFEVNPVMTSEYVSVTVDNAQEILDITMKTQESNPDSDYEDN